MFIDVDIIDKNRKWKAEKSFTGIVIKNNQTLLINTEKEFEEPKVSGQFLIIGEIRTLLPEIINYENLKKKFIADEYLNNIPLCVWDSIVSSACLKKEFARVHKEIEGTSIWSLADSVCAAKEAARQIAEE